MKVRSKSKRPALDVFREIRDAHQRITEVKRQLQEKIAGLPPPSVQSGITPVGPHACVVSFKALFGGSWSAESYIFSEQYRALAELVEHSDPDFVVKNLLKVIKEKRVEKRTKGTTPYLINLHPEVVKNLHEMLGIGGELRMRRRK